VLARGLRLMRGLLATLLRRHTEAKDRQHAERHSAEQLMLLEGIAARIGAKVGETKDCRILSRDGTQIESTFFRSDGRLEAMIWRANIAPPGWPNFDLQRTGLHSTDPDVMQQIWPAERLGRLRQRLPGLEVWCVDSRLSMRRRPAVLYASVLDASFELMFELVLTDPYATRVLRRLGAYHETDLPYVVVDRTDAKIGFARVDDRLVTEARVPVEKLAEPVIARARALGDVDVAAHGGHSVLRYRAVIRDPQKLGELASLLRDAATPREGVFR
jgi:hypothetical protein